MRLPTHRTIAGLFMAASLLLPFWAEAETIHVPADFPTIHEALDAAASGDEVLVAPGTYSATTSRTFTFVNPPEVVTLQAAGFLKPGVTLRSEGGDLATRIRILQPGPIHGLVMAQPNEDSPTVVQGFTFQAPLAEGAAILARELLDDGTLLVQECSFEELAGRFDEAGAIHAIAGGSVRVITCAFRDVGNEFNVGAIGTAASADANGVSVHLLEVQGSTFEGCFAAAIHSGATTTRIKDSQFIDGGSVRAASELHALVEGCSFAGTGGVFMESVEPKRSVLAEVRRCTFVGPAGVTFSTPRSTLEDCSFTGSNQVILGGPNDVIFRRNVFREVHLSWILGIVYGHDVVGEVSNNTFVGCSFDPPLGPPGGVVSLTAQSGALSIHRNIFAGTLAGVALDAHVAGFGTLTESCNCYWQNADGNTLGFTMSPTSFVADPMFCDPSLMEVTIRSDSPCAPPGMNGCGLVGAGAVACGPTALDSSSWAKIKALYR